MTQENAALLKDAVALVRESRHVKRAAGWADITGQLCQALEHSEAARAALESRLQLLQESFDAQARELAAAQVELARRVSTSKALTVVHAIPDILTITLPEG